MAHACKRTVLHGGRVFHGQPDHIPFSSCFERVLTALHIRSDAAFLPIRQAAMAYTELAVPRLERRAVLLQNYHFDINARACASSI